jgi:Calcineurin-like phosphoesterase
MKKSVKSKTTAKKSQSHQSAPKIAKKKTAAKKASKRIATPVQPLRFAHPFFTTTPPQDRATVPGVGKQLMDHIKGKLQPVPAPTRKPVFTLAEIIGTHGSSQIEQSGSICFHTVGDTGKGADSPQGAVAEAMAKDFDVSKPEKSPAFFFHLGDVLYGPNKDQDYRTEFYEPYVHYPGKIVAIPGNHDGEVFTKTDPASLRAFLENFCAPSQKVPAVAGTIYRQTMNQPGVYYLLDAPFVQIVALYSNTAENPGFISGDIPGSAQKTWLLSTLTSIAAARKNGKRKALVIATHHPPFTAGGHSPSTAMLGDIDSVCQQAGVMPDLFLSGHAHSYQRYTRKITFGGRTIQIPYVVAGTGGINDQAVPTATGQVNGDHTFVSSYKGYGYVHVTVDSTTINATMYAVDNNTNTRSVVESFKVYLKKNTVT